MIEKQVDETALTVHGVTRCSFSSLSPNPPHNTPLKTSSFLFCCRCMLGYQDLKARPVSSPKRMLKTRTLLRSFYGPGMLPSCALLLSAAAIFHRLRKNPLHFYCPFPLPCMVLLQTQRLLISYRFITWTSITTVAFRLIITQWCMVYILFLRSQWCCLIVETNTWSSHK